MSWYFARFAVALATFLLGVALNSLLSTHQPAFVTNENTVLPDTSTIRTHYDFFSISPSAPADENLGVITKRVPCTDKTIKPIWSILMRDKDFRENVAYSTENTNCTEALELFRSDLNRDGNDEILLRGKIIPLCGGVGNCQFWVFEQKGYRYKLLLSSSDYVDRSEMGQQIRRSRTKGYSDLVLKGHFSASDTSFTTYKFDGRKYRESRCLYETYRYNTDNKPVWYFVSCKEFYRRLGL